MSHGRAVAYIEVIMVQTDDFVSVRFQLVAEVPAKESAGTGNHHFMHCSIIHTERPKIILRLEGFYIAVNALKTVTVPDKLLHIHAQITGCDWFCYAYQSA